jgi:membrane associated rhomboid family serine protease
MIIPWVTNSPEAPRPWGNYIVMAAAIAVFAFSVMHPSYNMKPLVLSGWSFRGLFGYMWLHAGYLHIIINMVFLWSFGNVICSRLGSIAYVLAYVCLGFAAGCCQLAFDGNPAVGASGAICGVTGMYLVLYPWDKIRCILLVPPFFWRFYIMGFLVIIWWFFLDVIGMAYGFSDITRAGHPIFYEPVRIAHLGHICGLFLGMILAGALLVFRALPDERPAIRKTGEK